ncbi:hypothetical protein [Flavobacterium sp. NRK1]|uniref:hypothetical protein n=1 Tax=Flavobacterium sp. NRK1 TaxID=2954929 RepID=UPI0020925C59|nr:hypothetical protein [Flavobacterium sp. NRK1]MCO6148534.1 hypothetical protein [Flavobacterium sp. NRK1]
MKLTNIFTFILFCIVHYVNAQKIKVNKNLAVEQSKIFYKGYEPNKRQLYCYDIMNNDTITVYIVKPALEGYTFKLQFFKGNVVPKVVKITDYPAFDGKSSIELELSKSELEINDTVFKSGDTLRVKFMVISKDHRYYEKKKFKGEIFHIIGGNRYVWENGKSIHHKFWKNGKTVYSLQKPKED